jgi:NTE family protein
MTASEGGPAERIALALSGGGSRAIAFHLGCLRALHAEGILDRVQVISAVSGGSVLAALYCSHDGEFPKFEACVRALLASGLVRPALKTALTTSEGVRALLCFLLFAPIQFVRPLLRLAMRLLPKSWALRVRCEAWLREPPMRRFASRTTILRRALSDTVFDGKMLPDLRGNRPKLIVVACELCTKSAFYFSPDGVGSWRLGETDPSSIEIAHAVAASAAYPVFLPALDEYLTFNKKGVVRRQRVILTDGGVYDNLGLAPLWPDRDPGISLHADPFDTIVACRAGYGLEEAAAPSLSPSRMIAATETMHARAQNFAMKRLFDLKNAGALNGFVIPYLGQDDSKLAYRPPDLVTREATAAYSTDFSAMPAEWIERLSRRGEQLTLALLKEHLPNLLAATSSRASERAASGARAKSASETPNI